jgi:hypothetical protein
VSDEKSLELETLDKQIAHLRAAADAGTPRLWQMTHSETHEFQHKVLIPLEAKQKERRVLAGQIKAAETRRRNAEEKRKQKEAQRR